MIIKQITGRAHPFKDQQSLMVTVIQQLILCFKGKELPVLAFYLKFADISSCCCCSLNYISFYRIPELLNPLLFIIQNLY